MKYSRLAKTYSELEATQSTLEKSSILAELFRDAEPDELEIIATLVMGRPFPAWMTLEVGVGSQLMIDAISKATGMSNSEIEDGWAELGDLGDVAESFVSKKKQQTLASKTVTVELVRENLEAMARLEGTNSQERKIAKISELIGFVSPQEARYIVRTILGALRLGVGEGTVRDAIIEAFFAECIEASEFTSKLEQTGLDVAIAEDVKDSVSGYGLYETFEEENEVTYIDPDTVGLQDLWRREGYDLVVLDDPRKLQGQLQQLVQHAYDVTNDFGQVARIAAESGAEGLAELEMELFRPVSVMLAQKAERLEDGMDAVGDADGIVTAEYKYDGMRVQIHKDGDEIKVFTRRLEDVTRQFPDIVEAVEDHVTAESCIIEGEAVAYDPESGEMVPFQTLSKRIKRKYDIAEMVEQIPVTVYLFDILRLDGEPMLKTSQQERWDALGDILDSAEKSIVRADHIETTDADEVDAFYQQALRDGQEGIMLKNRDARYKPGSRVGYMVKLKPLMETLDLVVVEAKWSEGRKSDWLGRLFLACQDDTGEFRKIGRMSSGFTDEQLAEITERFKDLIIEEDGRRVTLRPEVVLEVAYEEIQESPTYGSGYALRFPRLVQIRDDLSPNDVDTLEKVQNLYDQQ